MKPYHPNFSDPRVVKRIQLALGWCCFNLSPDKPRGWHKDALSHAFGQQQNPLSRYLRGKLLICYRSSYSYRTPQGKLVIKGDIDEYNFKAGEENDDAGNSKSYLRNQAGYEELLQKVSLKPEEEETTNQPQGTGGISVLQVAPSFGERLGLKWAEHRYGAELAASSFSYRDKGSGRLTHGLQNVSREHKGLLWQAFGLPWNYDVVACAPTLLYQAARRTGLEVDLPAYDTYLTDRTAVRQWVATLLGIPVALAKKVLTSLFNGARFSTREKDALMKLLRDGKLIRRLQADPLISRLKLDIGVMWSHIRTQYFPNQPATPIYRKKKIPFQRQGTGGISVLQVPWYHRVKCLTASQRWSFYYKLERQVLDAARAHLDAAGCRYFLEHDGWRASQDLDCTVLSQVILTRTGYQVEVEKEHHG